jgi:hypothetical protein
MILYMDTSALLEKYGSFPKKLVIGDIKCEKLAADKRRESAGKSRQEVGGASPSHGKG